MSSMTSPGPEVAGEKRETASTSRQDHEGVDQGFAQQLDVRMALFPRHDVGAVFLQAPLGLLRRKALLEVCSFCNTSSGSLPAASRSSGETWMAGLACAALRDPLGQHRSGQAGHDAPWFPTAQRRHVSPRGDWSTKGDFPSLGGNLQCRCRQWER